jgi:hypothetical protein
VARWMAAMAAATSSCCSPGLSPSRDFIGEDAGEAAGYFDQAFTDGQFNRFATFGDAQLAGDQRGHEIAVRWKDSHFTLIPWKHDGIDHIRVDAGFRGDDFEFEGHGRRSKRGQEFVKRSRVVLIGES